MYVNTKSTAGFSEQYAYRKSFHHLSLKSAGVNSISLYFYQYKLNQASQKILCIN